MHTQQSVNTIYGLIPFYNMECESAPIHPLVPFTPCCQLPTFCLYHLYYLRGQLPTTPPVRANSRMNGGGVFLYPDGSCESHHRQQLTRKAYPEAVNSEDIFDFSYRPMRCSRQSSDSYLTWSLSAHLIRPCENIWDQCARLHRKHGK